MTQPADTSKNPWQGDWKERLSIYLESHNFGDLEAFLDANPGVGYVTLAKQLGDANVAPMQLYGEHIQRAKLNDRLRNAAMDCLVRFINEYVRRGWDEGRHFAHRSASAFAAWSTAITTHSQDASVNDTLKRVYDELERLPIHSGWLPSSANDRFIISAFEKGWPLG
jgi:hypothetical protein